MGLGDIDVRLDHPTWNLGRNVKNLSSGRVAVLILSLKFPVNDK